MLYRGPAAVRVMECALTCRCVRCVHGLLCLHVPRQGRLPVCKGLWVLLAALLFSPPCDLHQLCLWCT